MCPPCASQQYGSCMSEIVLQVEGFKKQRAGGKERKKEREKKKKGRKKPPDWPLCSFANALLFSLCLYSVAWVFFQ